VTTFRTLPLPRVLSRPNLLMGGERRWVLTAAGAAAGIGLPSANFKTAIVCLLAWMLSLMALREIAKIDPQMTEVYMRSIKYRRFYPARSRPFCNSLPRARGFRSK
jgi:type IV secretion system protein VirB3